MSTVHWFVDDDSTESVPLGAQYLAEGGKPNTEALIIQVRITGTGALVITRHFKGMVFRSKPEFDFLIEALNHYCEHEDESYPLVACVKLNGYLVLGVDFQCAEHGCWIKDNGVYHFRNGVRDNNQPTRNPFLPESAEKPPELGKVVETKTNPLVPTAKSPRKQG